DAVPAAIRPDVPDDQAPQEDVAGGAVVGAAVVDVQAVAPDLGDHQAMQFDIGGIGEVQAGAPLDHGGACGVGRCQDDRLAGLASQPPDGEPAPIGARCDPDR